ncbi:hypothetical protein [Anaplasma capra]|nr:hypothetical protein [Anaplasma capra]MCU7612354.1 hypothetical protein [Anaplasma capra]
MLFDIDIEVGGERLTMQKVTVDEDSGSFNACACNGNQQKRVDGVWSSTYLVISVGDDVIGECNKACATDKEITKGHMYVFDQWADEVTLKNGQTELHANFDKASGVMKFSFEDGGDLIEFVDATEPTVVKFKAHGATESRGDAETTTRGDTSGDGNTGVSTDSSSSDREEDARE